MSNKIYVARRENLGSEYETYSKYDWDCFDKMRKMEKATGFNADYPFTDIVSFELKEPTIEITFAIPEPPKESEPPKSQSTENLLYENKGNGNEGIN